MPLRNVTWHLASSSASRSDRCRIIRAGTPGFAHPVIEAGLNFALRAGVGTRLSNPRYGLGPIAMKE
jgi:hypothetical protein